MPPSPAIGRSPGRELRADGHKRGRSLESGIILKEKDDDLALFKEMQNREKDNFLLDAADDFDETLSTKLRHFSDLKLGISIPTRGVGSNLLEADGDKNDYDWLLTPPDTPLFPSLDDEPHTYGGRAQTQPISIPRSATGEKTYRTSRSSASPHRSSPSPRSESGIYQSRGRSPSAHSSKNPVLPSNTQSRSPSTPPHRSSTPAPRSSTPTPRRTSAGSSGTVNTGRRGTSPVKASRANSVSPKLQAWQTNLPGFSTEAPPNLRTSLSDRPASYVRGSSPASRNGRGLSPSSRSGRGLSPSSSNGRGLSPASSNERGLSPTPRNGRTSYSKRQSMSPTPSRSTSSSYGHDRDHYSSHSKGSVASSGDDDIDSLQSVRFNTSDHSATRKVGPFPNSRPLAFSKKPSRIMSPSSAPKRSFDSAIRPLEWKSPQNMFRPLLSSVPSTGFYVGKGNTANRSMVSRNSSVTTSSNASSELCASIAPDTEGSDHEQDHMATDWRKVSHSDAQDDALFFGKVEGRNENAVSGADDRKVGDNVDGIKCTVEPVDSQNTGDVNRSEVVAADSPCVECVEERDCNEKAAICSECGRKYIATDSMEENDGICLDCIVKGGCLPSSNCEDLETCSKCSSKIDVAAPMDRNDGLFSDGHEKGRCMHLSSSENSLVVNMSTMTDAEKGLLETKSPILVPEKEPPEFSNYVSERESALMPDETNVEQGQSFNDHSAVRLNVENGEQQPMNQNMAADSNQSSCNAVNQQMHNFNGGQSLKVDTSEGAGISLLLKRSNSSVGPIVQARTFTAGNIPFDDLSYVRDGMNSMRSSIGHGSASTSSSVDFSSSRQMEGRVQRQLSCTKFDLDSRHDFDVKRHGTLYSGIANQVHETSSLDGSNCHLSVGTVGSETIGETLPVKKGRGRSTELVECDLSLSTDIVERDKLDCAESCRTIDGSTSELSYSTVGIPLGDSSVAALPNENICVTSGYTELPSDEKDTADEELLDMKWELFSVRGEASVEDSTHCSVNISGENEVGQEPSSPTTEAALSHSKRVMDELHDCSTPRSSEKGLAVLAAESCPPDYANSILEESIVTVERPGRRFSRSLTLDEATDTILFCSSIIHDLAYQAANIAIEKENLVPLEELRPTIPKSSSDKKEVRSTFSNTRTPKSKKTRRRRVETDAKTVSPQTESNINSLDTLSHDSRAINKVDSTRPPKLESKCNCTVM
ncbi:hypothetical protein Sjap_023354 [Stephania japonica]|uniref:Uncharacterized protein n=1 Tax=Stephania japonica TaxID=461633 RepID=A0AAP0HML2_9MAGN